MKNLRDVILEKLSVNNISFDNLPDELKEKYNLILNPKTEKYDCDGDIKVKDDLIENGHFICDFGIVKGSFNCSKCKKLESLKGAPVEVGKDFDCSGCKNLESLQGAPEKVGRWFDCNGCEKLKTLEGAPKKVGRGFYCYECSILESLKGAPEEVGGDFVCSSCPMLADYTIGTKIGGRLVK